MIRVGLRALLALFALALCAGHATQAQAACGDWLAGHPNHPADQDQAAPVNAPPRCSGPSCEQSPAQEPSSPLSEWTITVDKAALMAESLTDLVSHHRHGFAAPGSDRWLPNRYCSPLERPPRS